jgi:hypothetical protein
MSDAAQFVDKLWRALRRRMPGDPRAVIKDDGQIIYRLPPPLSRNPSCLMFTQPKSGSKMVRGILRQLATESGLQPTGPDGAFFAAGVPKSALPAEIFKPTGYFYHFSGVPFADEPPIAARSLVHVRDIRDVLVSKYFSLRESHPEPGDRVSAKRKDSFTQRRNTLQNLDVDEGVLSLAAGGLPKAIMSLRKAAGAPCALLTRYEDMVYRKEDWAQEVCDHFGWERSRAAIARAVAPFDVFPKEERPDQHVRQVHPGNYKRRLKPETIEILNTMFREELTFFGYDVT